MDTSSLFRQLGLAARGAANGTAALPSMLWNGPVGVINQVAGTNIPLADLDPALDALGLPRPESATERVAQDIVGGMTGSGGVASLANRASRLAATDGQRAMAALFANAPGTQVASAAAGAGAGGIAREAGVGPGGQLAIGLGTGLLPTAGVGFRARNSFSNKLDETGVGPWGPVYGNLAGDPENAIAHLLNVKRGSVPAAETHPLAGPVDLIAKPAGAQGGSAGVPHIGDYGRDDVLSALPELLRGGAWYGKGSTGGSRTYLGDGTYEAVLRDAWDGEPRQVFLQTAYAQYPDRKIPLETGGTTNFAGLTGGQSSASQRVVEGSIPPSRNPRQYIGILPPEEAAARRQMLEERLRAALFGGVLGTAAEGQ